MYQDDSRPGDSAVHDHSDSARRSGPTFGSGWWERHHQDAGTDAGEPSPYVVNELAGLRPGTVLDAGCGTGADAIWLAGQGWEVTAVDISPTALDHARGVASREAPDLAARISWIVADLTVWEPPRLFDVVLSQYVHVHSPFEEFIGRLAAAVAPGGTLLVVGHDRTDIHSQTHPDGNASVAVSDISQSRAVDGGDRRNP
jgi:SAM-dependent methyltransferase